MTSIALGLAIIGLIGVPDDLAKWRTTVKDFVDDITVTAEVVRWVLVIGGLLVIGAVHVLPKTPLPSHLAKLSNSMVGTIRSGLPSIPKRIPEWKYWPMVWVIGFPLLILVLTLFVGGWAVAIAFTGALLYLLFTWFNYLRKYG